MEDMEFTRKGFLIYYLLTTATVWAFYACILPLILFIPFYGWGLEELVFWWAFGSVIEFVIAYPLWQIMKHMDPKYVKWSKKF